MLIELLMKKRRQSHRSLRKNTQTCNYCRLKLRLYLSHKCWNGLPEVIQFWYLHLKATIYISFNFDALFVRASAIHHISFFQTKEIDFHTFMNFLFKYLSKDNIKICHRKLRDKIIFNNSHTESCIISIETTKAPLFCINIPPSLKVRKCERLEWLV